MLQVAFEKQSCTLTKFLVVNSQISRTLTSLELPNQVSLPKNAIHQPGLSRAPIVVLKKNITVSSQCWLNANEFKVSGKKENKRDDVPVGYSVIYDSRFPSTPNFLVSSLYHWIVTRQVGSVLLYIGAMAAVVISYGGKLPEAVGGIGTLPFVVYTTLGLYAIFTISFRNSLLIRMYYNESTKTFIAIVRKNFKQQAQISFKSTDIEASWEGPQVKLDIKGHTCYALKNKLSLYGGMKFFNEWLGKGED